MIDQIITSSTMTSPGPDRKALEEVWHQRLGDARLRVTFAQEYLRDIVRDLPLRDSDSGGHFEYRRAVRSEKSALRDYHLALRIYQDLTVHGIVPDESEWLKRRAAGAGEPQ